MKFIAGVCVAIAISAVGMTADTFAEPAGQQTQAPAAQRPGTETVNPQKQAQAKNLIEDVTLTGCVRQWKPAPEDVTKAPESREPGVAGIFLFTTLPLGSTSSTDLPTYLLTPTQLVNFAQYLDDRVEVVGVTQAAPLPPTVQEIVTTPTLRPENTPNTQAMPRLTVRSLKKLSDSCP